MFVYTLKASGLKFFAVILASVVLLTALIAILPSVNAEADAASVRTDFTNITNEADMVNFLSQFGYEIEPPAIEVTEITIPEEFNSVFEQYNEIQRAQGLNLKRFRGKEATAYTFRVLNYGTEGDVFATLIVRNECVIAGDICSPDGDGFVHGFRKPKQ